MKRLVMFDCFGVILEEVVPRWFRNHFEPEEAERLKHRFFDGADRGERSFDQTFRDMERELGFSYESILKEYDALVAVRAGIVQILDALRRDHRDRADVILVSNCAEGNLDRVFYPRGLDRKFDRVFESWRYRTAKPDPAYYRLCIDAMNTRYDAICMIDDNKKNLEPLPALGIVPILYTSPDELKRALAEFLGSPIRTE